MEKASQKPVTDHGKDVTGTVQFVPEKSDGIVEVSFQYDATQYYDKELVAFEQLYIDEVKDRNLIASHEDYEDAQQTFLLKDTDEKESGIKETKEETKTSLTKGPKTGDSRQVLFFVIIGVAACGALILSLLKRNLYSS